LGEEAISRLTKEMEVVGDQLRNKIEKLENEILDLKFENS
jgi:hypothetical protein